MTDMPHRETSVLVRTRARRALRGVLGLSGLSLVLSTAGLVWSASPAAADHFLTATPTVCFTGGIAGPTTSALFTDHLRVTVRGNGTVVLKCVFHSMPAYISEADSDVGIEYFAPKRATRYTDIDCVNPLSEDYDFADSMSFIVTPGRTGVATCVFRP